MNQREFYTLKIQQLNRAVNQRAIGWEVALETLKEVESKAVESGSLTEAEIREISFIARSW